MKKMFMLFAVVLGFGMTAVHAADTDPRLEEAANLRVQSAKAAMQADQLLQRAQEIEMSVVEDDAKKADKTRGRYPAQCIRHCLDTKRDLFTCSRACGAY